MYKSQKVTKTIDLNPIIYFGKLSTLPSFRNLTKTL